MGEFHNNRNALQYRIIRALKYQQNKYKSVLTTGVV